MSEYLLEKWQKDLDIYKDICSFFVLEGKIFDKQPYCEPEQQNYIPMSLSEYIHRYLMDIGYELVVFHNVVEGFHNEYNSEMIEEFESIVGKLKKDSSLCDDITTVAKSLEDTSVAKAIVFQFAKAISMEPDHLTSDEYYNYIKLVLSSFESVTAKGRNGNYLQNIVFLIVEKANDIPVWFYLNNPKVKVLTISKPEKEVRKPLIESRLYLINGEELLANEEKSKIIEEFSLLTEGMTIDEIDSIVKICISQNYGVHDIKKAIKLFKYGTVESHWDKIDEKTLKNIKSKLLERVKGQPEAISRAASIIRRACLGLSGLQGGSQSRPKGILFLAGPTGTGKTELAKTIAEIIFGDEDYVKRFDMSEYGQGHSDQRLIGAPPGYVGYGAGGELTNVVKQNPFCILLFDEIEKADPKVFNIFLQILEDGRLTDSSGETVYFSETFIIFTSNIGMTTEDVNGRKIINVEYEDDYSLVKQKIEKEVDYYFTNKLNRRELLNRIGENIIVFDFIRENSAKEIFDMKLKKIVDSIYETKGIWVSLSDEYRLFLLEFAKNNLSFGGRGIGNILESEFQNGLADIFVEIMDKSINSIKILKKTDNGELLYEYE